MCVLRLGPVISAPDPLPGRRRSLRRLPPPLFAAGGVDAFHLMSVYRSCHHVGEGTGGVQIGVGPSPTPPLSTAMRRSPLRGVWIEYSRTLINLGSRNTCWKDQRLTR